MGKLGLKNHVLNLFLKTNKPVERITGTSFNSNKIFPNNNNLSLVYLNVFQAKAGDLWVPFFINQVWNSIHIRIFSFSLSPLNSVSVLPIPVPETLDSLYSR